MRLRTGLVKKLLLSGATVFSLVGFVSPAVFAMNGGNGYSSSYNGYNNYNDNYGEGNSCMMRYGNDNDWDNWDSNRYCMSYTNYSYSSYNYNNRCDHQYSKQY